jgi:ABC-type nitrate/sulfonate/bicarbonate transport system permease component
MFVSLQVFSLKLHTIFFCCACYIPRPSLLFFFLIVFGEGNSVNLLLFLIIIIIIIIIIIYQGLDSSSV